jgi:hypothetical protein
VKIFSRFFSHESIFKRLRTEPTIGEWSPLFSFLVDSQKLASGYALLDAGHVTHKFGIERGEVGAETSFKFFEAGGGIVPDEWFFFG